MKFLKNSIIISILITSFICQEKIVDDNIAEIKFYIPKIEEQTVSILLKNQFSNNSQFSFVLVEDKNSDNSLLEKLDNETFLFSLINDKIENINYEIKNYSLNGEIFLYEEVEYSKFSNPKYLLIRIFSCENEDNTCVFSKTKKIFLENLKKDEQEDKEFGVTNIEEFTEYKITRNEFIFSYDYKSYLNEIGNIYIYITIPKTNDDIEGEFQVINPLIQNFTFKYRAAETISLAKGKHVVSNGKYYFIFKDSVGLSFFIHNTMRFLPLDKINNYILDADTLSLEDEGLLYFTMNLEKEKYIHQKWSLGNLYLYSIDNKTIEKQNLNVNLTHLINKGKYLYIMDLTGNDNGYYLSINTNHYLIDLEPNKEIKIEKGKTVFYDDPTIVAVVDASKYSPLYLVSDSQYISYISCEESMDIKDIIKNTTNGNTYLDSHIKKIDEISKGMCEQAYYNIKLQTTRFELVTEVYEVSISKNFVFQQNNTIAFTVIGKGYNLIISNKTNMRWIDKMESDYVDIIFNNKKIQFILKPDDNNQTNLEINILENKNNINIETLTNQEISKRIEYKNNKKEIKYYINLSNNKYLINHFDYIGKLEFYISKDDINGNNLEEILKSNDINLKLFVKLTENKFYVDSKKILAIIKENNIYSELLMAPLIHSIMIDNSNFKYLVNNKKYFLNSYMKIILEENSEAKIKVFDLNNNDIFTIDKNNPIFENINHNKTLFLKSDKDTYINNFHEIGENSKNFEHANIYNKSLLIIFSSDCQNNQLKYSSDIGFINYSSFNSDWKELKNSHTLISFHENSEIKFQKDEKYITYMECNDNNKLIGTNSGFYENSIKNEGSYLIGNNKDIYFNASLDSVKSNIFYQIIECNQDDNSKNELLTSLDDRNLEKLEINNHFIISVKKVEFFFKVKEQFIFNFYRTNYRLEYYNRMKKNESANFAISYVSKNKLKLDISPPYENFDFDIYFFMIINNKTEAINATINPFKNKCYMKELIDNEKINSNKENIIIKKIEYKFSKLNNNIIETPNLEIDSLIYYNILASGKIYENLEEYIFYTEQNHTIKESDFPKEPEPGPGPGTEPEPEPEPEEENNSIDVGAIIGIIFGIIIIIAITIIVVIKLKNKYYYSINVESLNKGNFALMSEI